MCSAYQTRVQGLGADIPALLLLNSLALPFIYVITDLLRDQDMEAVLLGLLRALLGGDVTADL